MNAPAAELDHLVIVAATLDEGVAYCERMLGARMLKGGEHARIGTHNFLLGLGSGMYLEVIAINPAASAPEFPRWFGMDNEEERQRARSGPYLAGFVVRTNDIERAALSLPALGAVHDMQRGSLLWKITIPPDGALVEHGTVPAAIQWPPGMHPVQSMPDSGCRLEKLEAHHPRPPALLEQWSRIGLRPDERLSICPADPGARPFLSATISTAGGTVTLR